MKIDENRSLLPDLPVDKDLSPMETDNTHPKEFRCMDVHPKKWKFIGFDPYPH